MKLLTKVLRFLEIRVKKRLWYKYNESLCVYNVEQRVYNKILHPTLKDEEYMHKLYIRVYNNQINLPSKEYGERWGSKECGKWLNRNKKYREKYKA